MINSPGTIDSDYRGEVMIALINLGRAAYTVRRGDRIAQMVIQRVRQGRLEEVSTSKRPRAAPAASGIRAIKRRRA